MMLCSARCGTVNKLQITYSVYAWTTMTTMLFAVIQMII